jgi:hypothetical protein
MTRDEAMLNDHLAGASLRELGQRYSLSHEGVRLAIARQGRQVIDRIHLDLLTSHATGEMPTFVVPGHAGPDFDLALEYVRWVTQELEERGLKVRVHYRPTYSPAGVVLALEDAGPPSNRAKVRNR